MGRRSLYGHFGQALAVALLSPGGRQTARSPHGNDDRSPLQSVTPPHVQGTQEISLVSVSASAVTTRRVIGSEGPQAAHRVVRENRRRTKRLRVRQKHGPLRRRAWPTPDRRRAWTKERPPKRQAPHRRSGSAPLRPASQAIQAD